MIVPNTDLIVKGIKITLELQPREVFIVKRADKVDISEIFIKSNNLNFSFYLITNKTVSAFVLDLEYTKRTYKFLNVVLS